SIRSGESRAGAADALLPQRNQAGSLVQPAGPEWLEIDGDELESRLLEGGRCLTAHLDQPRQLALAHPDAPDLAMPADAALAQTQLAQGHLGSGELRQPLRRDLGAVGNARGEAGLLRLV